MTEKAILRFAASTAMAVAIGGALAPVAHGVAIRSHVSDFEARNGDQGSQLKGTPPNGFDPTTPTPTDPGGNSVTNQRLRVGFERQYGETDPADQGANPTPTGVGGINAIWYFPLPVLAQGHSIQSADFSTALLPESSSFRTTDTTPRFYADLYALGFTRTPAGTTANSQDYFYVGANDPAPGEGGSLPRQRIQALFTGNEPFTQYPVASPGDPNDMSGVPVPKSTDAAGDAALLNYINSVYQDPNFVNDGQSFLILRASPDRPTGIGNGFNGQNVNGNSRYSFASGDNAENVPQTLLTLDVVPEPAAAALLGFAGLCALRRRRSI